jgi:hypothetical protein
MFQFEFILNRHDLSYSSYNFLIKTFKSWVLNLNL